MIQDQVCTGEEVGLRVGQVSEQLGVSTSTIRLWERRFGLPGPGRSAGGHRRYRPSDVDQLRALRDLLQRGGLGRTMAAAGGAVGEVEGVLAATRAVIRARTVAEVRDILAAFVRISGGDVVEAEKAGAGALPYDLAFGLGEPLLPTAESPSVARLRLERSLPGVHEDARRIVALLRASEDARQGPQTG